MQKLSSFDKFVAGYDCYKIVGSLLNLEKQSVQ